jgi:DNA-directed RNA polymerase subunit RPC12/RpoP
VHGVQTVQGNGGLIQPLACPHCGQRTIPVRPLPLLEEIVRCTECGHRERFRLVLATSGRVAEGEPERES